MPQASCKCQITANTWKSSVIPPHSVQTRQTLASPTEIRNTLPHPRVAVQGWDSLLLFHIQYVCILELYRIIDGLTQSPPFSWCWLILYLRLAHFPGISTRKSTVNAVRFFWVYINTCHIFRWFILIYSISVCAKAENQFEQDVLSRTHAGIAISIEPTTHRTQGK